jgi:formylglycine-generating enzyme required for sulfatase activity
MSVVRSALVIFIAAAAAAASSCKPAQTLQLELVRTESGLRVMRHEVALAEWRQCFNDGGCSHMPVPGRGASADGYPVTGINWFDAQEFAAWASTKSGVKLRLPTVEEWRGFSGVDQTPRAKLFTDPRMAWAADYGAEKRLDPTLRRSGGFGVSSQGVSDAHGNVWEWTSTCVSDGYVKDGVDRCPAYMLEGEHEAVMSVFVRDAKEGGCSSGSPPSHLGLRLVADPADSS